MRCSAARSSLDTPGEGSRPCAVRTAGSGAPAEAADTDDVNRDPAGGDLRYGAGDFATPRFTVGDHDKQRRVRRSAVNLFVLLDDAKAPGDGALEIGVPRRLVLEAKRRPLMQVIEEEEQRVGIASQADLRRRDVREDGQRHPILLPAQRVADLAEELRGALPAIARGLDAGAGRSRNGARDDVTDAHRRRRVQQDHEIEPGAARDGRGCLWPGDRRDEERGRDELRGPEEQFP